MKRVDELTDPHVLAAREQAVDDLIARARSAKSAALSPREADRFQQIGDELSIYLGMLQRRGEALGLPPGGATAAPRTAVAAAPEGPVGPYGAPLGPKIRPTASVPPLRPNWPARYPQHEVPLHIANSMQAGKVWDHMSDRDIAMFGLFSHAERGGIPPEVVDRALQSVTGGSRFCPADFENVGAYQRLLLGNAPPPTREELFALLPKGVVKPDVALRRGTTPTSAADVPVVTMDDFYKSTERINNVLGNLPDNVVSVNWYGQQLKGKPNLLRADAFREDLELDAFLREAIDDALQAARGDMKALPDQMQRAAKSISGEPKLKIDYERTQYIDDAALLQARMHKAEAAAADLEADVRMLKLFALEDAPEMKALTLTRESEAAALRHFIGVVQARLDRLLGR